MSGIEFEIKVDNRKKVVAQVEELIKKSLEECGMVAEGYAKTNLQRELGSSHSSWYVRKGGLINSIGYKSVKEDNKQAVYIGATAEYAPYVEFGTGIHYQGGRRTSWVYKGSDGKFHMTNGMKPRPYLKPAVADHVADFQQIFINNLSN